MIGFVMFIHAIVTILLIIVILMQAGRGGGLTEGFASAESMFGAKTNEFMVRATTILGAVFLVTSLGLAILSSQKGKSLMTSSTVPMEQAVPAETPEDLAPVTVSDNAVNSVADEAVEAVDEAKDQAQEAVQEQPPAEPNLPDVTSPVSE